MDRFAISSGLMTSTLSQHNCTEHAGRNTRGTFLYGCEAGLDEREPGASQVQNLLLGCQVG